MSSPTKAPRLPERRPVSVVVAVVLARQREQAQPERVLRYSFYSGAVGFLMVPFFESAELLCVASFMFGLGMGCGTPLTVMMMFNRSSEGRSGRTLGVRLTTTNAVRVLGPIVFGGQKGFNKHIRYLGERQRAAALFPVFSQQLSRLTVNSERNL